jgi:glycosyltransferase involved in cell wall biosynthesis
MRVGIDSHGVERSGEGNATYGRGLISALVASDAAELVLFAGNPDHPFYRSLPSPGPLRIRVVQGRGLARLGWSLGRAAMRARVDGLHVQYTAPLGYRRPLVVTVHDVSFLRMPHFFPLGLRVALRALVPRSVARAARIITDSEFCRRDIMATYGVPADRIAVIPLAADARFHPRAPHEIARVLSRYGLEPGFLFALGRLNSRKNLERLLRAHAQLRRAVAREVPLVVGGAQDDEVDTAGRREDGVRFVGYIPDDDLPAFYCGAAGVVYPSLFEGFGLPVLEAMASGSPVVTSDRSALPELVADSALTVDPEDVDALTDAMRRVVTDPDLAAELRRRGLERSRHFSWLETARRTLDVYQAALTR